MFSKAEAYERFMGRWSRRLAPQLIEFCGDFRGDAVLDVGSGTGALSFAVRDATETARVTGIEPSPEFVAYAAGQGTDARVQFQVGDAQNLPFGDAAFDLTLSLLVVNFIPDRPRALSEMVRVTKTGGIVAAAVWDYSDGMQMLHAFWDEAIALDAASAPRDEAHMPLCRSGELKAMWAKHGLQNVEEGSLSVALGFASFDDFWAPFLLGQGPAGAYVAALPKDRRTVLERRLRDRLLRGAEDRAIDLQARAWAVKGTVPR